MGKVSLAEPTQESVRCDLQWLSMTSKYSSIADSSFTGHGYEAEACSVLEHAFSTQRCEDDEHGPVLNSEDGNVASSDSKEVFYWNVRHQCRRYKQGYASKDELKGLWLNCAVTKGWRFNPRNIGWFSTWEAWKDIMPLREVDCILRPKPNVDWSSLTEPGWQDDAGKRVSWDYLASLVPEAGAYCEITKPSKAETQNFKTVDKTEKINWLCRMAHWRNMGVVLVFNGADPTKPPFTRTEDNRLCKPIYWCQKELRRWPVQFERNKAQAERNKAQKLLSAERNKAQKLQKLLSAEREKAKKLEAENAKLKQLEAQSAKRQLKHMRQPEHHRKMPTSRPLKRIRILRMRKTAT